MLFTLCSASNVKMRIRPATIFLTAFIFFLAVRAGFAAKAGFFYLFDDLSIENSDVGKELVSTKRKLFESDPERLENDYFD